MDIKWSVGVSYVNTNGKRLFTSYSLNARNKDCAESLARELFLSEYGESDMSILVEPEHLSSNDIQDILNAKEKVFKELNSSFWGKTYNEFVSAFNQFEGFSAHLSNYDNCYFWLNFMNLTVKAVYTSNRDCYIDTKEIYYTTDNGKKIVARNNWTEFYYCI